MNHDPKKLRETRKKPAPVRATVHIIEQPDRPMTQEEVLGKERTNQSNGGRNDQTNNGAEL